MKKIVITIFMFLLAIFLIGCEDYEDIKPDISEFAIWYGKNTNINDIMILNY